VSKVIQINALFLLFHRFLLFISWYKNSKADFKEMQGCFETSLES